MAPVVSVIVPMFDAARFVAEAIGSVRAQTLDAIEIIVVDDASTDDGPVMVAAMAAADARIRLLRQPVNRGPSAARNRGIAMATGRWIALLDADDAYQADRLARLVALAEARGADLCSDNLLLVPQDAPSEARPMIPAALLSGDRALGLAEFIRRNVADPARPGVNFGFLKPIMRRDFLRVHGIAYDERVRFAEDFALYADCLRAGACWWMSPEPGYRYRVRPDSLTQVQTVHDLGLLRRKQAVLLAEARTAGDPELVRLIRRHMRVVDRCYHYRAFTDDMKARRFGQGIGGLFASPRAALLVAEECFRQFPVIARKALRGGYRRAPC